MYVSRGNYCVGCFNYCFWVLLERSRSRKYILGNSRMASSSRHALIEFTLSFAQVNCLTANRISTFNARRVQLIPASQLIMHYHSSATRNPNPYPVT